MKLVSVLQISKMPREIGLARKLHDLVVSTKCTFTTIQFMPEGDDFFVLESNDTCEIGLTKKTYLRMFTEAHTYFGGTFPTLEEIPDMSDSDLLNLYFATLALLVTTNEYHTVWRIHECVVFEGTRRKYFGDDFYVQDLHFCTALATSRLARVNKSSTLFLWIRKLTILVFENERLLTYVILRLLKSMQLHFANYCASFTLQWIIELLHYRGELPVWKNTILVPLRKQCRLSLKDISMWRTLSCLLSPQGNAYATEHYAALSEKVSEDLGESMQVREEQKGELPDFSDSSVFFDLEWLLKVECSVYTPYECILAATTSPKALEIVQIEFLRVQQKLDKMTQSESEGPIYQSICAFCATLAKVVLTKGSV